METLALSPEAAETDPVPASALPQSRPQRSRLRVGLVAAGPRQPRWMLEAFVAKTFSAHAEIVLVALGARPPVRLPGSWRAYLRLDRYCTAVAGGGSQDMSSLADLRRLGPRIVQFGAAQRADWRDLVAGEDLDVLFALGDLAHIAADLGAGIPALAAAARYGCWGFRFGEEDRGNDAWAGLPEVVAGEPVSTSRLVACLADGSERVMAQSWTRTVPFSIGRNRNRLLRRTLAYPGRAVRDLLEGGADWFDRCPPSLAPAPIGTAPAADLPAAAAADTPGKAWPGLSRVSRRILQRGLQKLAYVDQWFLAYRFDTGAGTQQGAGGAWGSFACLMPPRDRFWADPFPLKWGERHLIFFEELPFAKGKAHISVVEVAADGTHTPPQPVLNRDYHLSYPFLFEAEGQLFMVPETGHNRTVELYRCLRIPDVWRLENVLLRDACYVDATLHQAHGRWWMFVNVGQDPSNLHDELHLYHADHFLGPWQPHRGNPVKSDVRNARCAGRLFEHDGQLYRPAQICVPLYGSGICLNRVTALSPDRYQEQEVGRIAPAAQSRVLGAHTFNRAGALTVVDGFLRRRRWGPDALTTFEPQWKMAEVMDEVPA